MLSSERADSNVAESSSRRVAPLDLQVTPPTASPEAVTLARPHVAPPRPAESWRRQQSRCLHRADVQFSPFVNVASCGRHPLPDPERPIDGGVTAAGPVTRRTRSSIIHLPQIGWMTCKR